MVELYVIIDDFCKHFMPKLNQEEGLIMPNTEAKKEYNRRYDKTLRKENTMRIRIPKELHTEIKIYAEEEKMDMWQVIKKGIDLLK